jgi:hypothetical protein
MLVAASAEKLVARLVDGMVAYSVSLKVEKLAVQKVVLMAA